MKANRLIAAASAALIMMAAPAFAADAAKTAAPSPEEVKAATLNAMTAEAAKLDRAVTAEAHRDLATLRADVKRVTQKRAELREHKAQLDTSIANLKKKLAELEERHNKAVVAARATAASRTTLEGAVKLTATAAFERAIHSPVAVDGELDPTLLTKLRTQTVFPSIADIRNLIGYLNKEVEISRQIRTKDLAIVMPDGELKTVPVTIAGGLSAMTILDGSSTALVPTGDANQLRPIIGNLGDAPVDAFKDYKAGSANILPVDITQGDMYNRLKTDDSLYAHLNAGGNLVWIIIGIGFLAFVLGLYQLVRLYAIKKPDEALLAEALTKIDDGKIAEAGAVMAKDHKGCVASNVLASMLKTGATSVLTLEKRLDEAVELNVAPLNKGIQAVGVAAAVAPLLGLLGTVTGMIATFDVITIFGNGDPKLLSGGISIALITTEVGLVVSIILMVLHYFLTRRLELVSQGVEDVATQALSRAAARFVKSPLEGYEDDLSH